MAGWNPLTPASLTPQNMCTSVGISSMKVGVCWFSMQGIILSVQLDCIQEVYTYKDGMNSHTCGRGTEPAQEKT